MFTVTLRGLGAGVEAAGSDGSFGVEEGGSADSVGEATGTDAGAELSADGETADASGPVGSGAAQDAPVRAIVARTGTSRARQERGAWRSLGHPSNPRAQPSPRSSEE